MQAVAWEFQQDELSLEFTETLWKLLLCDDEMSKILLRFVWDIPLKFKRRLIRAWINISQGVIRCFRGYRKTGPVKTIFLPTSVLLQKERPILISSTRDTWVTWGSVTVSGK